MEEKAIQKSKEETSAALLESEDFINNFKSIYHILNGAPDTKIKVFNEDKIIKLSDIYNLNDKIQDKFKTHNIITNKVELCLTFTNHKAMKFNSWIEFNRTKWDIPVNTESCSIQWDFYIKLPYYKMPQRHTLKVRMGSTIRPNEFFQLMFESDDDFELMEATADVVCKVDFINSVICNELINIVSEWYEVLEKNNTYNKHIVFLKKKSRVLAQFINIVFLITGATILYTFAKLLLNNTELTNNTTKGFLLTIYLWCLISGGGMYLFNLIGKLIGRAIVNKAEKISSFSNFIFTQADKNKDKEIENKNTKVVNQIVISVIGSCVFALLSFTLNHMLKLIK